MNGQILQLGQNHTHLPLLILAVNQSVGPVMELGNGDASTVNLHSLLAGTGRKLYSYDDNPDWVNRFAPLMTDWHKIELKPSYQFEPPETRFGVVLIDHAAQLRAHHAMKFRDSADFLVFHDIEGEGYAFDSIRNHFKYVVEDKRYFPWTGVVSNVKHLEVDWR